ncbi:MAG: RluA family pseudouridine synthase [Pseudomonadota bacterium]
MEAAGAPAPLVYAPPESAPRVLHEDAALLAVDKPALLLTVPGKAAALADCLESRVRLQRPDARIVHRLDRPTSGVVVMPRTAEAHRHIGLQFERRQVRKRYIARVAGRPSEDAGSINAPLCGDWPRRPLQMVHFTHGKPARTEWRVLAREPGGVTRVVLWPATGRTHQLRVHMAWLGSPILGDEFYAPPEVRAAAPRLQLHAAELSLRHPEDGAALTLSAPCPF